LPCQQSRTYSNTLLNSAFGAPDVASANGDSEFTRPQTWRRPGWSMRDVVRSTRWSFSPSYRRSCRNAEAGTPAG
jgi:hypothetical protein